MIYPLRKKNVTGPNAYVWHDIQSRGKACILCHKFNLQWDLIIVIA